ncbi:MAG: RHS repeat-associated core domain-containing protein [Pyrinomonadaceae bacterium]
MASGDKELISTVSTAGVSSESYAYDGYARVSDCTMTLASRSSYPMQTSYLYDTANRLTEVRYPAAYGMSGNPRKIVNVAYDQTSRLNSLSVNSSVQMDQISYNDYGQATNIRIGGGTANPLNEQYSFDANTGLMTNQKVKRGGTAIMDLTYEYNRGNSNGSVNGTTGNLTRIVDNLNHNKDRVYEYDSIGRLIKAKGGAATGITGVTANWTQEYTFDRYGNKLTTAKSGVTENSAAVPLDGLPSQAYDQYSNRITDSGTEYDFAGNMTRGKAPDGSLQRFEFDEAGRIVVIKSDAGAVLETNTYATSRERIKKTNADGSKVFYAWGGSSVIQEYTEGTGGTSGGSGSAGYSVNANPRNVAPGAAITINWTNPGGNTGSDWVGLYQVGAADTSFLTWQWAAAGTSGTNTISAPSTSGTYEIRYFTNNTYDKKATSGTIQVGSGGGGSSSTPFSWSKSYIYAGSRLVSTITKSGSTETTEYHHPDRLGTKAVSDTTANTFKEQATLPFGTSLDAETSGTSGSGSSGAGAPSNQRFTSYDRSGATGLDYAVNRAYNSGQSRFTQVDPIGMASARIGNPQSLNLFAYVQNNPVDFVDPSGTNMSSGFGVTCMMDGFSVPCSTVNHLINSAGGWLNVTTTLLLGRSQSATQSGKYTEDGKPILAEVEVTWDGSNWDFGAGDFTSIDLSWVALGLGLFYSVRHLIVFEDVYNGGEPGTPLATEKDKQRELERLRKEKLQQDICNAPSIDFNVSVGGTLGFQGGVQVNSGYVSLYGGAYIGVSPFPVNVSTTASSSAPVQDINYNVTIGAVGAGTISGTINRDEGVGKPTLGGGATTPQISGGAVAAKRFSINKLCH